METRYFLIFITIASVSIIFLYNNVGKEYVDQKSYSVSKFQLEDEDTAPTLDDGCLSKSSFEYFEFFEGRMKKRRKHLRRKCSEHGLDMIGEDKLHKPSAWEFLVNRKYHLIWCNIFKSASSSWMYNFNLLAGFSPKFVEEHKGDLLSFGRRRYRRVTVPELRDAQKDAITFIIARHPFERLLSAYIDKFQHPVVGSRDEQLCLDIVKVYRKHTTDPFPPKYPTFNEFVRWHLDRIQENGEIDMHLVSANTFCRPCLMKFDMILKFETLQEDQNYLIKKAWLENILQPRWENKSKAGNATTVNLQKYYSELTMHQLEGLYSYYKYDFKVFGYNATLYFKWVKVANEPSYDSEYYSEDNTASAILN